MENMKMLSAFIINVSIMPGGHNVSDNVTSQTTKFVALDATMDVAIRNRTLLASCLMFSAGVIGNILALVLMATSPPGQRKTMFYKLMAGLAFTDLIGTLATSPVVIHIHVTGKKLSSEMPICNYFSFMMIFAGFATMSLVCAMAIERYICLCHPYAYHCKLTKSYAKYAFIISWLLSILIATLPLTGLGHNTVQFPDTWCFFNSTSRAPKDMAFNLIYAIISFIAITATLGCNAAAIYTVLALKRRQNALSASQGAGINRYRSLAQRYAELHMVVMLLGVTAVFTICFGPLMVFTIICQTDLIRHINIKKWYLIMIRLASFNPILDPWVYLLVRRELRWKIIYCFKLLLGIKLQPPLTTNQNQDGDSPIFPRRTQIPDSEMSCIQFCFHCMCDPPIHRPSASLAAPSTSRAGQSNRSPSYIRRIASADSVLNVASRACIISQPSPSEEMLLQQLPPFKCEVKMYGVNDSPFSQNGI